MPNINYIVIRLDTNKTQLLQRKRLRKFRPSAPLVENFLRETDWQNDDNILVTHDDLFAQDDVQECVPINHPSTLVIFKKTPGPR